MLLEAAETVLGFDRTLLGVTTRSKNRMWWHQLGEQRQKDIDIEKSSNIRNFGLQLTIPATIPLTCSVIREYAAIMSDTLHCRISHSLSQIPCCQLPLVLRKIRVGTSSSSSTRPSLNIRPRRKVISNQPWFFIF